MATLSLKEALDLAVEKAGGSRAVASRLGISRQAVEQWTQCPAIRVLSLEQMAGGAVSRSDLRPDLYPREEPSPPSLAAE